MKLSLRIFLILFLFKIVLVEAQYFDAPGVPFIKNFSEKEVHSNLNVYGTSQGDNGELYFATPNGLVEFDTYAVEWMPEEIIVSVDGKPYFYYDDASSELSWPFCDPHNIILNLTIGGGWGGYYGIDESINSQKMTVNYVLVYESK